MQVLERSGGWAEFRAALREIAAPVATFLYADRGGAIGLQVAGWLPVRSIDTGLLPVPGRSSFYDWRGYIPFDDLPSAHGRDLEWLASSTRSDDALFERPVAWLLNRFDVGLVEIGVRQQPA